MQSPPPYRQQNHETTSQRRQETPKIILGFPECSKNMTLPQQGMNEPANKQTKLSRSKRCMHATELMFIPIPELEAKLPQVGR